MEEIAGNGSESKLLELLKQQNETIQKQQAELNEKEMLIKSLQERIVHLESGGVETRVKLLEVEEENKSLDSQPMETDSTQYNNNESEKKKMKGESAQVNQPITSEDNSAQIKALRNPLILTKILRNMRTKDLIQNSRLVNREWRDLSTDVLLKWKNIRLTFFQHHDKLYFYLAERNYQRKELTLGELTSLLYTSTRIPFVNFVFHGNLKLDDAQTFLSEFGSNINRLELRGEQDMKFLKKLFLEQVPNLEKLELDNIRLEGELMSEVSPKLKLPSLTCLKLWGDNPVSLVKEILEAAPNLQSCTGIWSVEQIELLSSGRIHMLKDLWLEPEPNDLEKLEKLTKIKLQLKCLDMHYDQLDDFGLPESETNEKFVAKFDRINSKILSLNRSSLEEITLSPHYFVNTHIEWPELINVVELTISGDGEGGVVYPSFKISEKFPKLRTLCIRSDSDSVDQIYNHFPDLLKNVTPSVKVLNVDGFLVKFFPQYCDKFPNIQHLSLGEINNKVFPRVAPALWNMKKLKTLKLEFSGCTSSQIDTLFTGMKEDTCRFLQNLGQSKMELSELEKFRVNPSLLNLKDLQELHLPRGFQKEPDEKEEKWNSPSFVSFKFAFNLLPQLFVSR